MITMISPLLVTMLIATEPKMSYLENDQIKVGVDLAVGGAITYLAPIKGDNVVNNWDWGRQIQMSYYSGPTPFEPAGKKPAPPWKHLGWNPVQAGDHFRNPSKMLDHRNDGKTLYVKSQPMQWPLDHVPSECTFECWISLKGSCVQVRSRLINQRTDRTQYSSRMQELPAVYVNAPYHRLMTYTGEQPFNRGDLQRIQYTPKPDAPWTSWLATENWAAQVDDRGFGLGVYHPRCYRFSGGFAGVPGKGGTKDTHTGYIAPNREEILDYNIEHEFEYVLILDHLDNIRREVYRRASPPRTLEWNFQRDRQGWIYRHATDRGWPIRGELDVSLDQRDPHLVSPAFFIAARETPALIIEAALTTAESQAQVYWSRWDAEGFQETRSQRFPINGDGTYRQYTIDLSSHPEYRGTITSLRIDPSSGNKNDRIRIKSIRLGQASR